MKLSKSPFSTNGLIKLNDNKWLEKQRIAGKIASDTLKLLKNLVISKCSSSMLELNEIAEEYIHSKNGVCTFKNYKGFPAGVCISVNNQLVHGIPTNYKLQDGDLVSFDLGVTIDDVIADTAITCIYGDAKSARHIELIKTTEECLAKGIESIKVGKRLGCIGNAIYKHASNKGFGVITNYGGHGISYNTPHEYPFICNKASQEEGEIIQPGLTIAIEPLLCIGSSETKVDKDGWTVCTSNLSAHFEHSIYVHENSVEIIT